MNTAINKIAILMSLALFIGLSGYLKARADDRVVEKPLKAELVLTIGSDKENEDFFNPRSFAIDQTGRIFILDTGNGRVQCFSKEGQYQFTFGQMGQGPGELSNNASNIKILNDGNIYVIDNHQYKINVYSPNGKFLSSGKIPIYYDDIILANNTYYLSSMLLLENHKPITLFKTLGKSGGSFGIFIEPAVGLVKEVSRLPNPQAWASLFRDCNFTNLLVNKKNEIIFSQEFPYRLIKYDTEGRVIKDLSGAADFDTYGHVEFTIKHDEVSVSSPRMARVLHLSSRNEEVLVPFMNPEKTLFFIDIYDSELNLLSRYKIRNEMVNDKKKEYINQTIIDNDNNLYVLVISKEDPARLLKYKLSFD